MDIITIIKPLPTQCQGTGFVASSSDVQYGIYCRPWINLAALYPLHFYTLTGWGEGILKLFALVTLPKGIIRPRHNKYDPPMVYIPHTANMGEKE